MIKPIERGIEKAVELVESLSINEKEKKKRIK